MQTEADRALQLTLSTAGDSARMTTSSAGSAHGPGCRQFRWRGSRTELEHGFAVDNIPHV